MERSGAQLGVLAHELFVLGDLKAIASHSKNFSVGFKSKSHAGGEKPNGQLTFEHAQASAHLDSHPA